MDDAVSSPSRLSIFLRNAAFQILLFVLLLALCWGGQRLYSSLDQTKFPAPVEIPANAAEQSENAKGKLLLDAITHQMRYELGSTFGWTFNDILCNRFLFDNRSYRQYGVYHATKCLLDLYATDIAKLGSADRESDFLYRARINLGLLEKYKKSLDDGSGVFNCRTDDLYTSFNVVIGENLLGYALGLLENAQGLSFSELDNRIYEVQGIVLVVRDFVNALYALYPEIKQKNNEGNMSAANVYLDKICNYDPLYITSSFNSGELIISYLLFARARLTDISKSLRI